MISVRLWISLLKEFHYWLKNGNGHAIKIHWHDLGARSGSVLVQYMRAKKGHSTVWRPVNNPISRRTDETKSVKSELVTQSQCSSPQCFIQRNYSTEGTRSVLKYCFSLLPSRLSSHWGVNQLSACSCWSLILPRSFFKIKFYSLPF